MTSTCVMTSVPRFAGARLPAGLDGVARRRATCARRDARHATAAAAPRVHPRGAPRGPIVLTRAAPDGASTPARRWDKSKSADADADGANERQVQRKRVRARARRPSSSHDPFHPAVPPEIDTVVASSRLTRFTPDPRPPLLRFLPPSLRVTVTAAASRSRRISPTCPGTSPPTSTRPSVSTAS